MIKDIDIAFKQVTGRGVTHQERLFFISIMSLLKTDDPGDPAMVLAYMAAKNEADFAKNVDNLREILEANRINFETVHAQKTDELFNKFENKVDTFKIEIETLNESQSVQRAQELSTQLFQYQNEIAQTNQEVYQRNADQMIKNFRNSMNNVQHAIATMNQHNQDKENLKLLIAVTCAISVSALAFFFGTKFLLISGMHIADGYRMSRLPYEKIAPLVSESIQSAIIQLSLLVVSSVLSIIFIPRKQIIDNELQFSTAKLITFLISLLIALYLTYRVVKIVIKGQIV